MSIPGAKCSCASCNNATSIPVVASPSEKNKTRYTPPQPDANTFATQEAFLESLAPVAMDSIDKNSARCPSCWKPYGEAADPGFDNSELPVRLRCNHVFGDKCLRATFALPGTASITLRPLAFSPGSRGRVLGQRLHSYAQKQSSIGDEGNVGVFTNMLAAEREGLIASLGQLWYSIIKELRSRVLGGPAFHKVTLLDNAMILDRDIAKTDIPQPMPFGLPTFNPVPFEIPTMQHDVHVPGPSLISPVNMPVYVFQSSSTQALSQAVPPPLPIPFVKLSESEIRAELNVMKVKLDECKAEIATNPATAPKFPDIHTLSGSESIQAMWTVFSNQQTTLHQLIAIQEQIQNPQGLQTLQELQKLKELQKAQQQQLSVKLGEWRDKMQIESFKRHREIQKQREREFNCVLAVELAQVYSDYLKCCITPEVLGDQETAVERRYLIPTDIYVHKRNAQQSSYQVESLDRYVSLAFQQDNEGSDTDHDEDFLPDSVQFRKLFPVIIRKICTDCCITSTQIGSTLTPPGPPLIPTPLTNPTSLWWRNTPKIPDGCPICHRVLFRKDNARHRVRYHGCDTLEQGKGK